MARISNLRSRGSFWSHNTFRSTITVSKFMLERYLKTKAAWIYGLLTWMSNKPYERGACPVRGCRVKREGRPLERWRPGTVPSSQPAKEPCWVQRAECRMLIHGSWSERWSARCGKASSPACCKLCKMPSKRASWQSLRGLHSWSLKVGS